LRRLRNSARLIDLDVPMTDDVFERHIHEAIEAFLAGPGRAISGAELYVRFLVARGVGDMTYSLASAPSPTTVIIVKPLAPPPPAAYEHGVKVALVPIVRNHPASVNPLIKSNNLLNNALAMREAIRRGAFEAILHNYRGELAECSQSNLFIVTHGTARTPSLASGLLPGITREFILEVADEAGVPIEAGAALQDADLFDADEAFLTSTTREIVPIVRVDDRMVGDGRPGPMTRSLLEVYRRKADALTRDHASASRT
jgi:branched-chain amino acid aminotransferase